MSVSFSYLLVLYLQARQLLRLVVQQTLDLRQFVDLQLLLQQPQVIKLRLQIATALTFLFSPVHTAGDEDGKYRCALYVHAEGVCIYLTLKSKMVSSVLSSCSFT